MSYDKFKRKIKGMSDKELHKIENRLGRYANLSGAGLIGMVASSPFLVSLFGIGGALPAMASAAVPAYTFGEVGKRLNFIEKELDKRHSERKEQRQRLKRELTLVSKGRLKKVL